MILVTLVPGFLILGLLSIIHVTCLKIIDFSVSAKDTLPLTLQKLHPALRGAMFAHSIPIGANGHLFLIRVKMCI